MVNAEMFISTRSGLMTIHLGIREEALELAGRRLDGMLLAQLEENGLHLVWHHLLNLAALPVDLGLLDDGTIVPAGHEVHDGVRITRDALVARGEVARLLRV